MAPLTRLTSAPLSTTSASSWTSPNLIPCWLRSVEDAHSTTWSRCSKRRWGGSNDPDDLIVRAFKAYELEGGKIEAEMFRHALMNFGDKFSKAEVDDIFGEFEVDDDGFIESKAVIGLFVAG